MPGVRLVIVLCLAMIAAPAAGLEGTAEAQVWKLKKGKAASGTAKKTAAKPAVKSKAKRAPIRKKKRPSKPQVQLVPEDDADDSSTESPPLRDPEPEPDDEPIVIEVEEI
jgi:hypothetical protein